MGVVFIAGLSVGMYYGMDRQEEPIVEVPKPVDSVQDIVLKKVQSVTVEEPTTEKIEAISKVDRISPYAKMIIEKEYTKCGHRTVNVLEVPKELVNLTKEELKEKYTGWEVKSFSPQEFTLFRYIDANCEDHFVLKEEGGYVAVYNEVTEEVNNLVKKTEILVEDLREEDKHDLEEGIKIFGQERLEDVLEEWEV